MVYQGNELRKRSRSIKDKAFRESDYKRKLMKKLKGIPNSYWFSKEAGSIRGISDIIGCVNGTFVAIEVKRSQAEADRWHPRNALQDKFLADIQKVNGKSYKVFPENEEEVLVDIRRIEGM